MFVSSLSLSFLRLRARVAFIYPLSGSRSKSCRGISGFASSATYQHPANSHHPRLPLSCECSLTCFFSSLDRHAMLGRFDVTLPHVSLVSLSLSLSLPSRAAFVACPSPPTIYGRCLVWLLLVETPARWLLDLTDSFLPLQEVYTHTIQWQHWLMTEFAVGVPCTNCVAFQIECKIPAPKRKKTTGTSTGRDSDR